MNFLKGQHTSNLNGNWQFNYDSSNHKLRTIQDVVSKFNTPYHAVVPGNFELDLLNNHIIPDPYFGSNIKLLEEYENKHIWYYRKFEINELDSSKEHILVFEGLDCITNIYINGSYVTSTDNMMIVHEVDISGFISTGENEIVVHIKPTIQEALKKDYPLLSSGFQANYQSLYIRKPAHMFGWDILPRIISAGIFRPIYIEHRDKTIFKECYLQTSKISDDTSSMVFFYKCAFEKNPGTKWSIVLEGNCGESIFREEFLLSFQYGKHLFNFKNPLLWNPRGSGQQNLYNIKAALYEDGKLRTSVEFRHGIRTISLIRNQVSKENIKGDFHFLVNNKKVFTKGTNWVPADALHSKDLERIPRILEMAADLNCNIIRCWGGNLYENDLFYDMCDELGILVWQDFAMACAIYPQDKDFQTAIRDEAVSVIKRIRQHPCLALWAGDNECDQAYSWFGFNTDPNTNVLTRVVLPECVRNHDPFRDYLPSSPYIDELAFSQGDSHLPENHLWGIRDYYKSDYYAKSTCRFASEMGYHGCPSPESIEKFITKECIWPYDNEEWLLHSTSPMPEIDDRYNFRVQLMANQIKVLFGNIPDNIDDFSIASQISQGEAKKFFIELFRTGKWERTGIIWWNLMDGWPQFSDAIVDYYFNKKLAYEFIKRSQRDAMLTFKEPESGYLELVACNDTQSDISILYKVVDLSTSEVLLESKAISNADAVTSFEKMAVTKKDRRFLMITWDISGTSFKNHYLLGEPPFDFKWYIDNLEKLNGS